MNGKVVRWNDEKGCGFIKAEGQDKEIFFHISDMKDRHLRPQVNDAVSFRIKKTKKGLQAKRIIYTFAPKENVFNNNSVSYDNSSSFFSKFISISLIIAISVGAYMFFHKNDTSISKYLDTNTTIKNNIVITQPKKIETSKYRCDGRQYCSQMTSLEEANFFIRNCPNTKMDGDNDGRPCESDSRFR